MRLLMKKLTLPKTRKILRRDCPGQHAGAAAASFDRGHYRNDRYICLDTLHSPPVPTWAMTLRFTSMYATGRIAIFTNQFGTKARSRHVTAEFMNSGPRKRSTLVVRAESFMSGCTFPSVLEIILQKCC